MANSKKPGSAGSVKAGSREELVEGLRRLFLDQEKSTRILQVLEDVPSSLILNPGKGPGNRSLRRPLGQKRKRSPD
jgi:hypothetical protein